MTTTVLSDNREIMRVRFLLEAHHARELAENCFLRLAATVDDIPKDVLDAYRELFESAYDWGIDIELRDWIDRGVWTPASAEEYMRRFISIATGQEEVD
jgi:hypothetical protein